MGRPTDLDQLRQIAVDAALEAEQMEKDARQARRRANAKMKTYEKAVQERQAS